jgi:hypothetical protein
LIFTVLRAPIPAGLLTLVHPTPTPSRRVKRQWLDVRVWFRPDYSGASVSAFHRIPLAGMSVFLRRYFITFLVYAR